MDKKGLTGFQLKVIGLILMVFDHLYSFLDNMPIQFKWIGRIVAPIFIFMTVEGYYHTSNKKKYMLRLFIGSFVMNLGNLIVPKYFPSTNNIALTANIFSTLFMITIYLCIVDFIIRAIKEKNILKIILGIALFILPVALGIVIIINIQTLLSIQILRHLVLFIPNPLFIEGGPLFLLIGIVMYLLRKNRNKQLLIYAIISLAIMFTGELSMQGVFYNNYQWMMVFAAPLLYLYNGQKGRGMKYLFYIFYPVHIDLGFV